MSIKPRAKEEWVLDVLEREGLETNKLVGAVREEVADLVGEMSSDVWRLYNRIEKPSECQDWGFGFCTGMLDQLEEKIRRLP